jgi:hypothetical protein
MFTRWRVGLVGEPNISAVQLTDDAVGETFEVEQRMKSAMSDRKLESKGFTKYVKMGDGRYEKRAGQGPDVISAE